MFYVTCVRLIELISNEQSQTLRKPTFLSLTKLNLKGMILKKRPWTTCIWMNLITDLCRTWIQNNLILIWPRELYNWSIWTKTAIGTVLRWPSLETRLWTHWPWLSRPQIFESFYENFPSIDLSQILITSSFRTSVSGRSLIANLLVSQ